MSITGEINDPRFWRVSKSGYSIKTGWDINDQRIIATYPGAHLPGPVDGARFTQWLEDAERICELHNATIATAHMAAVLRDWAERQADRDDRDLLCRAAAMIEALTTPPAEAREPVGDAVLVPREPTEAFFAAMDCGPGYEFAASRAMWARAYREMLSQAQATPNEEIASCAEFTKPSASPSPASSASIPASGTAPACAEPAAATATDAAAPAPAVGREALPDAEWAAARMDLRMYGSAFVRDGKRIDPQSVYITTPPAEAREPVGVTDAMVEAGARSLWDAHGFVGDFNGSQLHRPRLEKLARTVLTAALAQPQATPRDSEDADTKRLDWLEAQAEHGYGWHARRSVTNRGYRLHQHTRGGLPTAREAIDAAMQSPTGEPT